MAINKVLFSGNLTRDAELRHVGQDKLLGFFTLAVNQGHKDAATGEYKERTDFVRNKCWGQLADNAAKYLGKGSKVFVEARVQTGSYDKDGQKEFTIDFVADSIEYLHTDPPAGQQDDQN